MSNPWSANDSDSTPDAERTARPHPTTPTSSQAQRKGPLTPLAKQYYDPRSTTADGVSLATFGPRVWASLLDTLILALLTGAASSPFWWPYVATFSEAFEQAGRGNPPGELLPAGVQLIISGIGAAIGLLYHIFFLHRKGATPGLSALKLRVVPVDEGRAAPGLPMQAALVRSLAWVLPGYLPNFLTWINLLDCLWCAWDKKRQTLHDLIAKTQVIRLP